jgi:hypothetical protein
MAEGERRPLLVVDAANVVGSVPDGWWRDRAGATERLRDRLAPLAASGLPEGGGKPAWLVGPLDIALVVEGAARRVGGVPGVRVVPAARSGDDAIVDLVRQEQGRRRAVVTADRELRSRVADLGADVLGPSALGR